MAPRDAVAHSGQGIAEDLAEKAVRYTSPELQRQLASSHQASKKVVEEDLNKKDTAGLLQVPIDSNDLGLRANTVKKSQSQLAVQHEVQHHVDPETKNAPNQTASKDQTFLPVSRRPAPSESPAETAARPQIMPSPHQAPSDLHHQQD